MPITYHPDVQVVSGMPIVIDGQLYDANGLTFDITNCSLAWCLLDPDGTPVPIAATITKTNPVSGAIQISVPSSDTNLPPGRFTDALQMTQGASTGLFWVGQILVAANPLAVS